MSRGIEFIGGPLDGMRLANEHFPYVCVRVAFPADGIAKPRPVGFTMLREEDTEVYTPSVDYAKDPAGAMEYRWREPLHQ